MRSDVSDIIDSSEPDKSETPYEPSVSLNKGDVDLYSEDSDYSTDPIIPTEEDPDMQPSPISSKPTASSSATISLPPPPLPATPPPASTHDNDFIVSDLPSDYNNASDLSESDGSDAHSSENYIEYIAELSSSPNISQRVDLDHESDSNRLRDSDEESPSSLNSEDIAAIDQDDMPNSDALDQLYSPCASEPLSASEGILNMFYYLMCIKKQKKKYIYVLIHTQNQQFPQLQQEEFHQLKELYLKIILHQLEHKERDMNHQMNIMDQNMVVSVILNLVINNKKKKYLQHDQNPN